MNEARARSRCRGGRQSVSSVGAVDVVVVMACGIVREPVSRGRRAHGSIGRLRTRGPVQFDVKIESQRSLEIAFPLDSRV